MAKKDKVQPIEVEVNETPVEVEIAEVTPEVKMEVDLENDRFRN